MQKHVHYTIIDSNTCILQLEVYSIHRSLQLYNSTVHPQLQGSPQHNRSDVCITKVMYCYWLLHHCWLHTQVHSLHSYMNRLLLLLLRIGIAIHMNITLFMSTQTRVHIILLSSVVVRNRETKNSTRVKFHGFIKWSHKILCTIIPSPGNLFDLLKLLHYIY